MRDRKLHLVHKKWLFHSSLEQINLTRSVVRYTKGTHLAGCLKFIKGTRYFFWFHQCIGTVQQQHIKVVRIQ